MLLHRPSPAAVQAFLAAQANRVVTYAAVGATAGAPPARYALDHTRVMLGKGQETFAGARNALEQWRQFQLGWVEAIPSDTPLEKGRVVAILARSMGLWWLNACRIVTVVDQDGPLQRFGFAYGTLPDHAGSGEEQFLIEWDRDQDAVWYDIQAFSRPHHPLTWLGYPWLRHVQKRFRRDSAAAMLRAVCAGPSGSNG